MSSESKQRPDWVESMQRPGPKAKSPLHTMEVGETCVFGKNDTGASSLKAFRSVAYNLGKRQGKRFYARQLPNGDYEVYRDE